MNNAQLIESFKDLYQERPECYLDTGGRFEIVGNHTDHNHGLCLVANASLRIKGVFSRDFDKISILSKGFSFFSFGINDLKKSNINNKTELLIKGILFKLKTLGYKIGGFKAYISSDIPDGGGVSSSAAIESLFGYLISYLYNDGKIPPIVIAKVGKYSENEYFGKPSGLLDQIGTSFDACNFIDFKNIENPKIETIKFELPLSIFLIKSRGSHAGLTHLYASIPEDMKNVAKALDNKDFLRDVENLDDIEKRIDSLDVEDLSKKRAIHFFNENKNVIQAKKALETNDVELFLDAVRNSQKSSFENLKNTYVVGEYKGSPQDIIDNVNYFLGDIKGAIRIHGGGFKGTVIAFVKNEYADSFNAFLESNYNKNRFMKVEISSKAVNFEKI